MDETAVQQFIQYVELDQRIDKLGLELATLIKRRQEDEQKRRMIEDQTADAFQVLHDVRKEVDMHELELKSIGDALMVKRKKLNEAHSPKEFFSLEHEIADLVKKQEEGEVLGLEALRKLEDAERQADSIKAREPELLKTVADDLEALTKDERHFVPLKEALIEEKARIEKIVDPELFARYKNMKEKVPNPVVPIIRGSCSGCFYSLSKQNMADAMHGKLLTCGDCHRLLYIPQAPQ